jgi:hypothetical protein
MSVSSEQHASAKITCETHIHPIPHVHPAANYLRKMSMTMNIALNRRGSPCLLRCARGDTRRKPWAISHVLSKMDFQLFGLGFNLRTAVDEGVVRSLFRRSTSSVAWFDPDDVEGDFVGHAGIASGACCDGQRVV